MKFCPKCGFNFRYDEIDKKLTLVCQVCGHSEESTDTLIYSYNYKKTHNTYESHLNYIYDPTFPLTIHYNCPNDKCVTKKDPKKKEAIYFNKEGSMRKIYICKACNTEWSY